MTEKTAIDLALRTFPFLETPDDARRFLRTFAVVTRGLGGHQVQIETAVQKVAAALVQAVGDVETYEMACTAMRDVDAAR